MLCFPPTLFNQLISEQLMVRPIYGSAAWRILQSNLLKRRVVASNNPLVAKALTMKVKVAASPLVNKGQIKALINPADLPNAEGKAKVDLVTKLATIPMVGALFEISMHGYGFYRSVKEVGFKRTLERVAFKMTWKDEKATETIDDSIKRETKLNFQIGRICWTDWRRRNDLFRC